MSGPNGDPGGSLRALTVYRPSEITGPDAATGYDELRDIGWLPGVDAPGVLMFADPLEDDSGQSPHEDPRGIELRRHPEAMLRDDPELWPVVDRFRAGVPLEVTREEHDTLSAWEIDARLIMLAATRREEQRQIRRSSSGDH